MYPLLTRINTKTSAISISTSINFFILLLCLIAIKFKIYTTKEDLESFAGASALSKVFGSWVVDLSINI
jgi:hypothetical protein